MNLPHRNVEGRSAQVIRLDVAAVLSITLD